MKPPKIINEAAYTLISCTISRTELYNTSTFFETGILFH